MRKLPLLLGESRGLRETWLCGYRPVPDGADCDLAATWHGFVLDAARARVLVMVSTCDEHLSHLKAGVDYAHPLRHPCGIPGSRFRWPENVCFTEWDEAAEFAAGLAATR